MSFFFPTPADAYERALWEQATHQDRAGLTREKLVSLSKGGRVDLATLLLHQHIVSRADPHLLGQFERPSQTPAGVPVHVGIVPGAFYRENRRTGADGRVALDVAAQLGWPTSSAPVLSTGQLKDNGSLLLEWLGSQPAEPMILVTVSKGSSDLKTALALPNAVDRFKHVIGWVNLCGILDGTPMADWLLSSHVLARANRFVYRIRGQSLDFLSDLQRYDGCPLASPLQLPASLRAVHVVGFPLRRHLRDGLVKRCHQRLRAFGPNDGAILLADLMHWPGLVCPVWGADHSLRPQNDLRPLLASIFQWLAR